MKRVGLYMIILGILLTVFTAVTYFTRKKVVDVGDLKISVNKPHHLNWSPFVGVGIIICGGLVYLLVPGKAT
jgi:uncharacterized membrane protein YidH (DUF202 family)